MRSPTGNGRQGSRGQRTPVAERRLRVLDEWAERGSVTAEFAAALPAVLLCLALCVGAIQATAQQARLLDHAATAARLIGRGDTAPRAPDGATRRVGSNDGLVCVTVTAPSGSAGLGVLGFTVSARSCVLDDTEDR